MMKPSAYDETHRTLKRAHRISKPVAGILTAIATCVVAIGTIMTVRTCEHREPPTLRERAAYAAKKTAISGAALYLKYGHCFKPATVNNRFVDLNNKYHNGRGCGVTGEKPDLKTCYAIMAKTDGFEAYQDCSDLIDNILSNANR